MSSETAASLYKRATDVEREEAAKKVKEDASKCTATAARIRASLEPWAAKHGFKIAHVDDQERAFKHAWEMYSVRNLEWPNTRYFFHDDPAVDKERYCERDLIPAKYGSWLVIELRDGCFLGFEGRDTFWVASSADAKIGQLTAVTGHVDVDRMDGRGRQQVQKWTDPEAAYKALTTVFEDMSDLAAKIANMPRDQLHEDHVPPKLPVVRTVQTVQYVCDGVSD
jgi:hypothetical protein